MTMKDQGGASPQIEVECGYIPLFRKSLDSQVFQDAELWKVWCWCLLRASYREHWVSIRTGRGLSQVKLSEGQFIYGRHAAGKELRMKSSSVRNRIKKLENMQNLTIQPDTHFSIVTICNWGSYKELMFDNRTTNRTTIGQAKDNQRTHTIKDNKGNNIYSADVEAFFAYFLLKTKKDYKLTQDKRELIEKKLSEGYTLEQLKKAVDNFVQDTWEGRAARLDLIYCIGKQKDKPDNLDKWLNWQPETQFIKP